jgi:AcrR family transcriptional regulator
MSTNDSGGMRERKKLATRDALSSAALRLALEHGPQNVRVDDIAEAAGVSPRTYNNYFSSREQAIVVGLAAERGARVAAALRARPVDEPLEHAVVSALIEQYSDEREPDRDTLALITSAPALQTIAAIERPLAEAIAARTVTDRDTGLGPEVLAAAVSAAARVAAQRWLQPEPDTRFSVMLHDALTLDRPCPARSRPLTSGLEAGSASCGSGPHRRCRIPRTRLATPAGHSATLRRPRRGHDFTPAGRGTARERSAARGGSRGPSMSSELLVQTRQPPHFCVRPTTAAPGRWPVEGVR